MNQSASRQELFAPTLPFLCFHYLPSVLPHDPLLLALLLGLVFLVVAACTSVGHGSASGYLLVVSFFELAPAAMAPSALCLNLLVSRAKTISF